MIEKFEKQGEIGVGVEYIDRGSGIQIRRVSLGHDGDVSGKRPWILGGKAVHGLDVSSSSGGTTGTKPAPKKGTKKQEQLASLTNVGQLQFVLVDPAAQESASTISPYLLRRAHGFLLLCDVSALEFTELLDSWYAKLDRSAQSECLPVGVLLSKADAKDAQFVEGGDGPGDAGMASRARDGHDSDDEGNDMDIDEQEAFVRQKVQTWSEQNVERPFFVDRVSVNNDKGVEGVANVVHTVLRAVMEETPYLRRQIRMRKAVNVGSTAATPAKSSTCCN